MPIPTKNEKAIKDFIAGLITTNTSMKSKPGDNVRVKIKTFEYVSAVNKNLSAEIKDLVLWTIVRGEANEDYTDFENSIHEAVNTTLFARLEIVLVRESMPDNSYQRYYEIRVL